jgi:hypothetical protein
MFPAVAVLFVTVVASFSYADVASLPGWQVACKAPLRFLRFASILCVPLLALPKIYSSFTERRSAVLLQVEQKRELKIEPLKHWVFRPFQGIGIGLLFGTKLLSVLQLMAGPAVGSSLLIPEGHFQLGRLLLITLITVFVSILLSALWTLDDMGIRYFNRRDQELKMIGKYAGTLMPVVFGTYGLLGLLVNYPGSQAFVYAFKIVVVLYPPFAVFTILHTYFLRKKAGLLSKKNPLKKGGILEHD